MTKDNIKELIEALVFAPQKSNTSIWSKKYPDHDDYIITLNFDKSSIDFGNKIQRGDDTTSNFSSPENFVVLECVDRLLTKGYKPHSLTLEKKWRSDKKTAGIGKSDITVTDLAGKTLIIIECKTWGKEYIHQKEKVTANGGQLFQYYKQDTNCKYLCLYTSCLLLKKVEKENALIQVFDTEEEKIKQQKTEKRITYEVARNVDEMLEVWQNKFKKEFSNTGIFEDEVEPYNPGFVPIRIKDLKEFNSDDAKTEYYKFEEILRHNNISDRSNAFNRFISLVLAKIVDEEKKPDEITHFQIKKGIDTPEEVIERMQTLYAKAMRVYLDETVINYTFDEIENIISHFPRQTSKEDLKRIYKELKFYTNNEFSFKEVYNHELFEQNAKVLFEVIDRLQNFRFKYNAKAQFLGDFFEDMLESGFKQSEGQFFTPTPIAKFMVSSIPLREIIEDKIKRKEAKILPSVIDYACGSGHFVTEAIEEIQQLIQTFSDKDHKEIADLKKTTKWAGDFICGIEKDYRLARTSQVACFMHGDGDAEIIFGDGLEEHDKMQVKLFDVLVANPPYAIKDFKKHLNKDRLPNYELLPTISEDSDDIEVMFVERTKQLLRVGGYAAVFLPSPILTNTGIYTRAREILLKYFELKAIVEFGKDTFSATDTKTVVMFMKRRDGDFSQNCLYIAEDLILGKDTERKEDFIDSHKLLKNYTDLIGVNLDDYKTLVKQKPSAALLTTDFFLNYKKWFEELTEVKNWKKSNPYSKLTAEQKQKQETDWFFEEVLEIEKEKFLFFLLTHRLTETPVKSNGKKTIKEFVPQQTLIIKSGKDNDVQKSFLGYTFSERRGYKGLDMKKDAAGKEITKLYDKENLKNTEKVNSYIYKAFKEEEITEVHESLKEHIQPINLIDCFNFEDAVFDKEIDISMKAKINWEEIWGIEKKNLKAIDDFIFIEKGTSITKADVIKGTIPVIAGGKSAAYFHNKSNYDGNVITISASGANSGYAAYHTDKIFASDCNVIYSNNEKEIPTFFFYCLLTAIQAEVYLLQRGQAQPHVYGKDLKKILIPVLTKEKVKKVIDYIKDVEKNQFKHIKGNLNLKDAEAELNKVKREGVLKILVGK